MEFFVWSFISWVIWGVVSIGFRFYEIQKKSIFFWNQILVQLALFFLFFTLFWNLFWAYKLRIPYGELSWFWIFFIVSNASYLLVKMLFEFFTDISLYPTDREIEQFIKDNDLDKDY